MSPTLAQLRQEIDAIDDGLHDLIMRRTSVVETIKLLKPAGPAALRPAREAQIMRRLLVRHKGSLPVAAIIELWQALLSASTCLQGAFTIAATTETAALAQARFGALPQCNICGSEGEAIEQAEREPGTIAILPWPGPSHNWWTNDIIISSGAKGRRLWITSCLPLTDCSDKPKALVLAGSAFEPSGDDYSLVVTTHAQSPFADAEQIAQSGEKILLRIAAYIAPDDARLDTDTILLGGYPKPLSTNLQ